jgi:hypothetical protein
MPQHNNTEIFDLSQVSFDEEIFNNSNNTELEATSVSNYTELMDIESNLGKAFNENKEYAKLRNTKKLILNFFKKHLRQQKPLK